MKYTDIYNDDDMAKYAAQEGSLFFRPDTMKCFGSRILDIKRKSTASGELKVVFVTSEKASPSDPTRVYSLRVLKEDGRVTSPVHFHQSLRLVKKLIRLPYDQMLVEAAKLKSN